MPAKNSIKAYAAEAYYHLYNRGVEKKQVFRDNDDYHVFLNLLKRYLSKDTAQDIKGRDYPNFHKEIDLLAFCLMPNHFHILLYQHNPQVMTKLLRSVGSAYGMYFNKKYERVGPVFQDRFKAVLVDAENQFWHISRYIHLNPIDLKLFPGRLPGNKAAYLGYPYSSIKYYLGKANASWVKPEKVLRMCDDYKVDYKEFLADFEDYRKSLKIGTVDLIG